MTTLEQAARQALEALQYTTIGTLSGGNDNTKRAIASLSQALEQPAQPEQEPVAFLANGTRFKMSFFENEDGPGTHVTCFEAFEKELNGRWVALVAAEDDYHGFKRTTPLYTESPKREWVSLTEEEISAIAKKLFGAPYDAGANRSFARAIEAKLKELNT